MRTALAWGVHAYTALGLPLALAQAVAIVSGDVAWFFFLNCAAVFVDGTDGMMARAVRVREVLPEFDGRKLDDVTDFLTFAFLPAFAVLSLDLVPDAFRWPLAAAMVMSSGYGFSQERAKTDESFVGFPSYWNILLLYAVLLDASEMATAAAIAVCAALVFVPLHYAYPTKTVSFRAVTLGGGVVWGLTLTVLTLAINAPWTRTVALVSLAYPAWYLIVSIRLHLRLSAAPSR